MKIDSGTLVKFIHGFFHIYLPKQKCYSANTIDSYKAAFNLFLDYMMEEHQLPLFKMTIEDMSKDNLIGFQNWLSAVRKNSSSTCNQRLMAFRSFAKYLSLNDFSLASVYSEVCCVPVKKSSHKTVEFLSEEGLKALLLQPDTSKHTETRNQFFMILMYDTAARCQELLDLRLKDISLTGGAPFVYLTGKGNKTRTVPLMDATVKHLMNYLKLFHPDYPKRMNDYLFYTTAHGNTHQMSRDTVALFMKKYGETAQKVCPDIPSRVHPHQLRNPNLNKIQTFC